MERKTQEAAAAATGMSERTVRRSQRGSLPASEKPPRAWRTRQDPFEEVWEEKVVPDIEGKLQAKAIFANLMEERPGEFQPGQLRTLQRRIRDWRAVERVAFSDFSPSWGSPVGGESVSRSDVSS